MARKKEISGDKVVTIRIDEDIYCFLEGIKNKSEFIRNCISEHIRCNSNEYVDAEIHRLEGEIAKLKSIVLEKENELTVLRRTQQNSINKRLLIHEERLKVLEYLQNNKNIKVLPWLQSRTDVLEKCGFKDVDEAHEYIKSKLVR